jgi:hypothetical protein
MDNIVIIPSEGLRPAIAFIRPALRGEFGRDEGFHKPLTVYNLGHLPPQGGGRRHRGPVGSRLHLHGSHQETLK